MKYLIIFALFLTGCNKLLSTDLPTGKIINDQNLRQFSDQCEKLAKCMGAKGEVVHFSNQSHDPYACSITKQGKTRQKGQYLYPKLEISFDRLEFDNFSNAITVCEILTETGSKSDEEYARMDKAFEAIDRQKAERLKQEKEWQAEQARRNAPVKIKEVK